MAKTRYTPTKPNRPGWWWMLFHGIEEPVEITENEDGVLFVRLPGRMIPERRLMDAELEPALWSLSSIPRPSTVSSAEVRMTLGDHAVAVRIQDGDLLHAQFPEKFAEFQLARTMQILFEEAVEPRRKDWQESIKRHHALIDFLNQNHPHAIQDFQIGRAV